MSSLDSGLGVASEGEVLYCAVFGDQVAVRITD
jgi:hypothetical protein